MKQLLSEIIELSSEERSQIDQIIPKIVQAYQQGDAAQGGAYPVGHITYKMRSAENIPRLQKQKQELEARLAKASDSEKPALEDKIQRLANALAVETKGGKVSVLLSNNHRQHPQGAEAIYLPVNLANLQDNVISVDQNFIKKYYGLKGKLTGREKEGEQQLRRVLTHELVHAKDPTLNHLNPKAAGRRDTTKKTTDQAQEPQEFDLKAYFKKPEEALAFASQLNDVIVRLVTDWITTNLKSGKEIVTKIPGVSVPIVQQADKVLYTKAEEIQEALRDLDQLFAKGEKARSMSALGKAFTKQIESQGFFKNFAKKVYAFLEKVGLSSRAATPQESYITAMKLLKKHNSEGYEAAAKGFRKSFKKLELAINTALYREPGAIVKAASSLPELTRTKTELETQLQALRSTPSGPKKEKSRLEKVEKLEQKISELNTQIQKATRSRSKLRGLKVIQIAIDGTDAPKEETADLATLSQIETELQDMKAKMYPKQAVKESNFSKNLVVERVYVKLLNKLKL